MTDEILRQIRDALAQCSPDQRRTLFDELRKEFPIHALERDLNAPAEVVMEAISRASDLTRRGIRGIVAEAYFEINVVASLVKKGWQDVSPEGDFPYDFDLVRDSSHVRIQIKNQRLAAQQPKQWNSKPPNFSGRMFVAETQRTRAGKDAKGASTRPYKFGEFDVLGVCLHPSTGNWGDFRYTVANWLVPRSDKLQISIFQPVSSIPNDDWTDDFEVVAQWLRSGQNKTIWQ